jgi:glycosyltransferase involved in cell wall biosynthesis
MPGSPAPTAPVQSDSIRKDVASPVKVSVAIITYNHDKTRDIVIEYQKKHPDKIRLLLHDRNIGANANCIQTFSQCKGDYIAYLEGDDFWIDRKKLQKQVAYLDQHVGFSMCYTGARQIDENGLLIQDNMVPQQYRKPQSQRDLISAYAPPALTVMERRFPLKFPSFSLRLVNLDYFEYAMVTEYGDAGYLPDITACHRMHRGGIWSMKEEEYQTVHGLELAEALLKHFGWKYKAMLLSKVRWYYGNLFRLYIGKRKYTSMVLPCLRLFRLLITYELTYRISRSLKLIKKSG